MKENVSGCFFFLNTEASTVISHSTD